MVSSVIEEAAKQLAAFDDEPVDFRILWLQARGRHAHVQFEQFKATLYGRMNIIDLDRDNTMRPCFFFSFSDFFRFRDVIDAAVISSNEQSQLCFNPLSPRYESFKISRLSQLLGDAVCDPPVGEAAGEAYIADFDGTRKDKDVVLELLQQKYGRPKLMYLEMGHMFSELLVPK